MTTLVIDSLTKMFGSLVAVDDISFEITDDDIVSIVGPNGAGKTTLFNLIKGRLSPTSGDIHFDGRSVVGLRPDQTTNRGIVRSFQQARGFSSLSVLDNLLIGMHSKRQTLIPGAILPTPGRNEERRRFIDDAFDLLEVLGLEGDYDQPASSLPYAKQKLTSIGMALASEPSLLLLDEPVAGMNPSERKKMLKTIREIQNRFNLTILLIEHDMEFVTGLSDRIIVLNEGGVIADGEPAQVVKDPVVVEAYLGRSDTHA